MRRTFSFKYEPDLHTLSIVASLGLTLTRWLRWLAYLAGYAG